MAGCFFTRILLVDNIAHKLAFKVVKPTDRPFVITLAISFYIICIMCPIMSLIATLLFKPISVQIISVWFTTVLFNFPMAFFCKFVIVGHSFDLFFQNYLKRKNSGNGVFLYPK